MGRWGGAVGGGRLRADMGMKEAGHMPEQVRLTWVLQPNESSGQQKQEFAEPHEAQVHGTGFDQLPRGWVARKARVCEGVCPPGPSKVPVKCRCWHSFFLKSFSETPSTICLHLLTRLLPAPDDKQVSEMVAFGDLNVDLVVTWQVSGAGTLIFHLLDGVPREVERPRTLVCGTIWAFSGCSTSLGWLPQASTPRPTSTC